MGESFTHQYALLTISLDNPILIHAIDGKPLNNGFISESVHVNLCIQDHSEYKTLGVVNMNCDLILSIDWLKQHNPSINWESNHLMFSCCKSHSVDSKSRDAQFLNCSSPVPDILIAVLSVNKFF